MLMHQLSLCVVAVDWSDYPLQEYYVLLTSLLFDGRSLFLLSRVVPSKKQQNVKIQQVFRYALAAVVNPDARVNFVTDAGFRHIKISEEYPSTLFANFKKNGA